jgi:hypothetical protein
MRALVAIAWKSGSIVRPHQGSDGSFLFSLGRRPRGNIGQLADMALLGRTRSRPAVGAIRQLADVTVRETGDDPGMEVRISLDQTDPPVGRLRVEPGPPDSGVAAAHDVPFTGWLGLLHVLSDAIGSTADPPPSSE